VELIDTEKIYVNDLEVMIESFYQPLQSILAQEEVISIFTNTLMVKNVSKNLYEKLAEAMNEIEEKEMKLGDVFKKNAPFLKCYSEYSIQYNTAVMAVADIQKVNKNFKKFLEDKSEDPNLKGLTLNDFLIKPIQRICKYPLFFRDIIDATKVEEPLYVVLSEVSTLIQEIVSHINNNTALRENFTKIMFYRDAIVDYKKELYVPNRILVRDGKLNKASGKIGKTVTISSALERQCILFDDVFVYCKIVNTTRFQFKGELEFTKVNLIDTNDNHPNHDVAFCIENPDTNKTYWLFFSTPKEKIDWFNDIKKCIEKKRQTKLFQLILKQIN